MTYKPLSTKISLFIAIAAVCVLGAVTVAHAGPDLEALDEVASLKKIYGEGEAEHSPGLPIDDETLRVYWFWAPDSPCSTRAEPALEEFSKAHDDVEVYVVHSNADQSAEDARKAADERNFSLPIYRDEDAALAIAFDVRMTPEAVALDAEGVIYRGRPVHVGRRGTTSFIDEVARQWRAGESIDNAYRRPSGCPIARP